MTRATLDPEVVSLLTSESPSGFLVWDVEVTRDYVSKDNALGDEDCFGHEIHWSAVARGLADKAFALEVARHHVEHHEYEAARLVAVTVRVVREAHPVAARRA